MGDTWKDGRRAWERLDGSPARTGEAALRALADIGTVRRLLDQAELGAVQAARADRRSWAEIATTLGVTRQSVWERWRDLDEPAAPLDATASKLTSRMSRSQGRWQPVVVPNLIGMSWTEARRMLEAKGLVAAGVDPDGIPMTAAVRLDDLAEDRSLEFDGIRDQPDGVVTDQGPESGAVVEPRTVVTLWIGRGGGSAGVREPRRPRPTPVTVKETLSEPSETVG